VLIRLICLAVVNLFSVLRLMPMSACNKDAEILVLRHQVILLQRQLGDRKVRFSPADRMFLAALLSPLPRAALRRLHLLVRPDTMLRWHRDLLRRRHARASRGVHPGRPRTVRSNRTLVLRLVGENQQWGYRRIHGELAALGIKVAASTVWEILKTEGIDPAPQRASTTWAAFLRSQAHALLACDFIETITLTGQRQYVLAVIEHATRRIRVLGATAHPTADWVIQLARNLVMDLEDAGAAVGYLIRDRDTKFPKLFDLVLADAGIRTVLSGIRTPRMNSIMERWVQELRHELLDRTLIWNQRHLLRALREFEDHHNRHRPHQAMDQAAPLRPVPDPVPDPGSTARLDIRRRDRLGGLIHEYRRGCLTCTDVIFGKRRIGRVYDHVTDVMRKQITDVLEARWAGSLLALTATERGRLMS
jgi:putative transposase